MQKIDEEGKKYLETLKGRSRQSKVFYSHQFAGLEIAVLLRDLKHKSLYIKLAKEHDPNRLLALAKSVVEMRGLKNPAAYFMKLVHQVPNVRNVEKGARPDARGT